MLDARAHALHALRVHAADALERAELWPLPTSLRALADDCDLRAAARVAWCGVRAAAMRHANEGMSTTTRSPLPAIAACICSLAMDSAHAAAAGDALRAEQYAAAAAAAASEPFNGGLP